MDVHRRTESRRLSLGVVDKVDWISGFEELFS